MTIGRPAALLAGLLLAAAGTVAHAHHSTAEFDYSKTVLLEGTVKEVQWTNPHSYIQVLVPNEDGKVAQWGIEIGAPALNVGMGWRKTSVKRGDKVKLNIAPARNGSTFGTLRHLTLPDGTVLDGVAARFGGGPLAEPKK